MFQAFETGDKHALGSKRVEIARQKKKDREIKKVKEVEMEMEMREQEKSSKPLKKGKSSRKKDDKQVMFSQKAKSGKPNKEKL